MTGGTGKPSNLVRASFLALLAVCQPVRACTPTVIWCSHESDYDTAYRPSSPLQRLTSETFESNLSFNLIDPVLVAEDLCIEDLRNNKVLTNATSGLKTFYFPCVVAPDSIFQKKYNCTMKTVDLNDDHKLNMDMDISLKDIDSNVCVALTGKQCRYSTVNTERIKRETLADNSTEFKIKTDRILLYSGKSLLFKVSDESKANLTQTQVSSASTRNNDSMVILTIKFTNVETFGSLTLEFFFVIKSFGYYTLDKVTSETDNKVDDLFIKRDISFPFNFSYHCSPKTVFANGVKSLSITDMQVQVDHKNGTFSDAYDCVGFTSIPIWTGIFVTVILGLIMIWALTMIMDIRTMDRFDDPKGKTITISSAE